MKETKRKSFASGLISSVKSWFSSGSDDQQAQEPSAPVDVDDADADDNTDTAPAAAPEEAAVEAPEHTTAPEGDEATVITPAQESDLELNQKV